MTEEAGAPEILYFNGIDGESGKYEIPPLQPDTLSAIITHEERPENLAELKDWYEYKQTPHLGVGYGINPNDLAEAGWGVIFPHDIDPDIIAALKPLTDLRCEQAGETLFRHYSGPTGYQRGMTKNKFLEINGMGPGPANPEKIPYYLLLVGDPEQIPYQFQSQLDVQYAVGRIHFETVQEYANYAASVLAAERPPAAERLPAAETGKVQLPRQAAFFGVANEDDPATRLSTVDLVQPLLNQLAPGLPDWQFSSYLAGKATRATLDTLLGGDPAQTPALLFSASHGMGFPNGSQRQLPHQGALLCQDWPGPNHHSGPIPEQYYFAGDHLPSDRNLLGMIAFLFACYGGGTPQMDQFSKQYFKERGPIAPYSFMARLPMKMLGLPRGGALAVVGHIERAWGYSFKWTRKGQQAETFESALKALLSGQTVGFAVEYFNERYAEISTALTDQLADIEAKVPYDPTSLARMWTANNDARGYAIIGDPAVRLPVVDAAAGGQPGSQQARPDIHPILLDGTRPETSPPQAAAEAQVQTQTPPASSQGKKKMNDPIDFTPPPAEPASLDPALKLELDKAYVRHVKDGYSNTDAVFKRIMRAFLISHYSGLIMYWLLFLIGAGLFVAGILSQNILAAIGAAVGVVGLIAYFITRSVSAVEQNLIYITWLGIIYNTYWVHQQWARDPDKAQKELDKANEDAIGQVKDLLNRFDRSVKGRANLPAATTTQAATPAAVTTTPPAQAPAKPDQPPTPPAAATPV